MGSWKINGDSQTYAEIELNLDRVFKFLDNYNQKNHCHVSLTHFFGKAMSKVYREYPEINIIERFGSLYYREEVNFFFHVAETQEDLSGHLIKNIDQKSLKQISEELRSRANVIRKGNDPAFKRIKNSWNYIPGALASAALNFISFITYGLNLEAKWLGVPKDSFGGLMITNIGSLGFKRAYVPLAAYTKVPLIFALGKIHAIPYINQESGEIDKKTIILASATFDHRVLDGANGAIIVKALNRYFEKPDLLLDSAN